MKNIEELHKLCDKVMDSITDVNRKLDKETERLTENDATYINTLAHILKSVKTVIAMEDYPDGYSGNGGWNYNDPNYINPNMGSSGRYYRDGMGRFVRRY